MIAPNIVIPFNGNHANIPTGFVRDTRFDGRNVKASNGYSQGGASTHTHSSSAHTHAYGAHTHTLSFGNDSSWGSLLGTGSLQFINTHSHPQQQSGAMGTQSDQNASPSWQASDHTPPSRTVIFIKSTGYNLIPTNGVVLRTDKSRSLPYFSDAVGKYLRGASTGGNAGSNVGSATHGHNINHSHTPNAHSHANVTTGYPTPQNTRSAFSNNTNLPSVNHTHTVYVDNNADSAQEYVNTTAGSGDTISLSYQEFYAYVNNSTSSLVAVGDIALWAEASAPPTGWDVVSTYDGKYIKIASEASGSLSSGGSLTHSHTSVVHTHTSNAHSHSGSTSQQPWSNLWANTAGSDNNTTPDHTHSVTVASATISRGNGTIDASSASSEPLFVSVRLIKATSAALGGGSSFLLSFVG